MNRHEDVGALEVITRLEETPPLPRQELAYLVHATQARKWHCDDAVPVVGKSLFKSSTSRWNFFFSTGKNEYKEVSQVKRTKGRTTLHPRCLAAANTSCTREVSPSTPTRNSAIQLVRRHNSTTHHRRVQTVLARRRNKSDMP